MSDSESPAASASQFIATRWTQVRESRGDSEGARRALSELCAAYYAPVQTFIRSLLRNEDVARDLTQEFFAQVLSGRSFDGADPERGRFRSFLLGAVKHFLADMRDREHAAKRGGGAAHEPIAPGTDTSPGLDFPESARDAPDVIFDRNWAHALLDRTLSELARELDGEGKTHTFEILKPWLTGEAGTLSQAEAGRTLGLSEGAAKVAVHRLRHRFRDLVKAEIRQTLINPNDVDAELRHLLQAVSG